MEIPAFLQEKLIAQYGEETARRILASYAARRPVTLRVNALRADALAVREQLSAAGIAFDDVPWSEHALILRDVREDAVRALPLYEDGWVYLQSLSSMLPPLVLAAQPGENVLDMAAAPGGKTTQIAALTGGGAMITACEKNAVRAERLRFNIARQGASRVSVLAQDALLLDELFRFDRILLDAPCSGSGTLSPEGGRGRFTPELLSRSAKAQRALLDKALRLLRPGCEMVYSTCSVLREENEQIVQGALASGMAELVPIDASRFEGAPLLPSHLEGTLLVAPDALYEGFFVAKLRRTAAAGPVRKQTKGRK